MRRLFNIRVFLIVLLSLWHGVAAADQALVLTPAGQAWLSEHPEIRIGIDAGYAPYSFLDTDGSFIGVAPDFIELLGNKLGVKFEAVPDLSWPQILQAARERSLDVIATAVITEERQAYLDFTEIYIPTPLVIMTRANDDRISTALDLEGQKVALVEGYSSSQRVVDEHPAAEIVMVANPVEGLHAVSSGNADVYVGVLGINIYQAQQQGITNLKVAGNYDVVSNGQRLAVRNDWPMLTQILERALDSISEEERKAIFDKWIDVPYVEQVDYSLLWKTIFAFVLIVSLMYLYNRRLAIEITRRQAVERELLELNMSLVAARDDADRANQTKSEFLSVMSHELRTPLTSIKGALGLLTGGALKDNPQQLQQMLQIACDNSDRLALLVDDILDFEKLQSGKMQLYKASIPISELSQKALSLNQAYADQFAVRLKIEDDHCADLTVNVDESRMIQVYSNLLSNAVKYSPKGDVVKIDISRREARVRVSIRDQGPGIPEAFQAHIFTRFSQTDTSNTRDKGGTGLGLAISKEIIECHGGIIGFDSPPGAGACFWFELDIEA